MTRSASPRDAAGPAAGPSFAAPSGRTRLQGMVLMAGLVLALAACRGGTGAPDAPDGPADSGRTVVVTLSDDMAVELSATDFSLGETVRFEVTNAGATAHEFYLGDAEAQAQHAAEMAEMGMSHDDPNGVAVEPGATESLEYTFEDAGEILAGCHEPGHYEAGMSASMTVAGE